jgi:hypothetical protein
MYDSLFEQIKNNRFSVTDSKTKIFIICFILGEILYLNNTVFIDDTYKVFMNY